MRGILPLFFSLTGALRGGFEYGLLNGINYRVWTLARVHHQCQFIPKPLPRSGKIEVVPLNGEAVGERNPSSGRMTGVRPVAGFQHYRMEHSEFRYLPGYSVNFHPITQTHSILSHQHEPTKKAHDEIFQRH